MVCIVSSHHIRSRRTAVLPVRSLLETLELRRGAFFSPLFPTWEYIWRKRRFSPRSVTPHVGIWQLTVFLILVLLFRRIPIVLAMKRFIPDIRTYREALFCGHFGPMGVGALFLAMEARGQLEGDGTPEGLPKNPRPPFDDKTEAIYIIWPVICFVVLGSTMVHGLSVLIISLTGHLSRDVEERAPLLGGETEGLDAMNHDSGDGESEPDISGTEDEID